MKQVINIYKKHHVTISSYLENMINSYQKDPISNYKNIFSKNRYIQLLYAVDNNFKQITPVIYRNNEDKKNIGTDKTHYFVKMQLTNDMYISNPYIHYQTGKASISIVQFKNNIYYVYDIDLIQLLEELRLIEFNDVHDKFKRIVYLFGSAILAFVSIVLIGYGMYILGTIVIFESMQSDFINHMFKVIISVTLGLAIYDLAKQIFEHEVLFRTLENEESKQYKVLGKFLISIIIALSIETLLVVFKIALSGDQSDMLSAFYLIIGTTIMFVGLGWFYKTIQKSKCEIEE